MTVGKLKKMPEVLMNLATGKGKNQKRGNMFK